VLTEKVSFAPLALGILRRNYGIFLKDFLEAII
jgi:hypothetical protein